MSSGFENRRSRRVETKVLRAPVGGADSRRAGAKASGVETCNSVM